MTAPVAFYFDFVSPYAYLASEEVEALAARHGRAVDWRPILLGVSVLKVMGLKAVPETPLKGAYADHDWRRFARLLGIPVAPTVHLGPKPLAALRAFTWAKKRDAALAAALAHRIFRAHWAEGRDMSEAPAVVAEAARLGLDAAEVRAAIESEQVKARLRQEVERALAAGVFGAPTFVVDGEMFWGADRLPQVERWLATGGW